VLMEGEEDVLKGTQVKYFELFAERNYKQGSASEIHFRLAESQFYRLLSGYATFVDNHFSCSYFDCVFFFRAKVQKVEYVCNPKLIERFK